MLGQWHYASHLNRSIPRPFRPPQIVHRPLPPKLHPRQHNTHKRANSNREEKRQPGAPRLPAERQRRGVLVELETAVELAARRAKRAVNEEVSMGMLGVALLLAHLLTSLIPCEFSRVSRMSEEKTKANCSCVQRTPATTQTLILYMVEYSGFEGLAGGCCRRVKRGSKGTLD